MSRGEAKPENNMEASGVGRDMILCHIGDMIA
jgi:hypothetical protein